jgi:molecular chaperone DnaK (HSP70)
LRVYPVNSDYQSNKAVFFVNKNKNSNKTIEEKEGIFSTFFGIDLGTSNCVVAYINEVTSKDASGGKKEDTLGTFPFAIEIPQVSGIGQYTQNALMASALYRAPEHEQGYCLPWSDESKPLFDIIGNFARDKGASIPDRIITSAKSWLCHDAIDRYAPILPWRSELKEKLSPFDITVKIIQHLKQAIDAWSTKQSHTTDPETVYSPQIVVTVPASFDETARSLTYEAAEKAGLREVILLEEPLAAFYDWIAQHQSSWKNEIHQNSIILVCDVGGGTADFTLIAASESKEPETKGDLLLERISVGDHILLGGDNMDLTLAYRMKMQLEAEGTKIDHWQFNVLTYQCKKAKEALLGDESLEAFPVSIPSRGTSLFSGNISTEVKRKLVHEIILEGFFPMVSIDEKPISGKNIGLKEAGLPYAADAALTKHLAQFLKRSFHRLKDEDRQKYSIPEDQDFLIPSHILFNGGVFNASFLRERLQQLLTEWFGYTPQELTGSHRDLSVARGAAFYCRNKYTGKGLKIRSGIPFSYYIGIESSMPAIPGFTPPVKALCVVQKGTEEGSTYQIEELDLELLTGTEVEFRFFRSLERNEDILGSVVEDAEAVLTETATLKTVITKPAEINRDSNADKSAAQAEAPIPITLETTITELGVLELALKHKYSGSKWLLKLNIRDE